MDTLKATLSIRVFEEGVMALAAVFRRLGVLGIVISLGLAMVSLSFIGSVYASDEPDFEDIEMVDDCDPATFGPLCDPAFDGDTTLDEFIAEFIEEGGVVDDWEFDPDEEEIDVDDILRALNEGGEAHTFTLVAAFGGGFVPELNAFAGAPVPECATEIPGPEGPILIPAGPALASFVLPGGTLDVGPLAPGTYLFMCCIHPWMQLTLTVEGGCEDCG